MKLVYRIVLHLTWLLSLLLAGWAVLFYLMMIDQINDETDDALELRAEVLTRQILAGRRPAEGTGGNDGYYLREVSADCTARDGRMVYTDEEIYIPEKEEREPARVLRMLFSDGDGRRYELTVMSPTIEKADLQEAILGWVVGLYGLLLGTILVVNAAVLHRTLRPLRALLRWLDAYRVGGENPPLRSDTRITEFRRLSDAANRYAERAESLFERQKQFIGNASHEMQTPLAVCRNRLEMLVDEADTLTEEQLQEIARVQRTLDHLVRLNRSLLLLSKIDNGQFVETAEVDLGALAERLGEELGAVYAPRGIRFSLVEAEPLRVRMNPSLAESLVVNLLKNAFVHTPAGGEATVTLRGRELRIANTASDGPLDGGRIFDRFYQGSKREGSTGLGLAIVEAICRLYGLQVEYAFAEGRHTFRVRFQA